MALGNQTRQFRIPDHVQVKWFEVPRCGLAGALGDGLMSMDVLKFEYSGNMEYIILLLLSLCNSATDSKQSKGHVSHRFDTPFGMK